MFSNLIQLVFSGCTTDIERVFAMLLFFFVLDTLMAAVSTTLGGGRR